MDPGFQLPPYAYRCEDRSWLTAWLGRTVVPWIERRVPAGVPANHVTLVSSLCLLAMTWLCGNAVAGVLAIAASVVLLVAYTLLDMVDGQHARRLGTSSPLGEYLDHTLDVLNAALVLFVVFRVRPEWTPGWFALALAGLNVVFVATLLEQKIAGTMKLGAIGPVEGLALSAAFLGSLLLPGAAGWWERPVVAALAPADLLIGGGVLFSLSGIYTVVRRLRSVPAVLAGFVAGEMALVGAGWGGVPAWAVILALALFALDYGGRVIASHLLATPRLPRPDWVPPVLMLAAILLGNVSAAARGWLGWVAVFWTLGRIVIHTAGVFTVYRRFWVWWHRHS